jgi:serine/threonine protein kinase
MVDQCEDYRGDSLCLLEELTSRTVIHSNETHDADDDTSYHMHSLPEYVSSIDQYTEDDCRNLFQQIVQAVHAHHENGIVHRNLNVDNIFVIPEVGIIIVHTVAFAPINF